MLNPAGHISLPANRVSIMEVIGAIASFIAIGQAIAAVPKITETLKPSLKAEKELANLVQEVMDYLYSSLMIFWNTDRKFF